jgi:hypothetical protein
MIGVADDRHGRTKQDREQPEENEGEIRSARQLLEKDATREEEHQASRGAEDEDPFISNERRNRSDRHLVKLIESMPRARRSRRCYSRAPQKRGKKYERGIYRGSAGGKAVGEYGRQTDYGKGGSMHIADFGIGMLGANGIVRAGSDAAPAGRHSAEFGMLEPKTAFADISDNATLAEMLLNYTFAALLNERQEDLVLFREGAGREARGDRRVGIRAYGLRRGDPSA